MTTIREATADDVEFCAAALIAIGAGLPAADPYVAGFPRTVGRAERGFVERHIGAPDSIVLIDEHNGRPIACLIGQLTESTFSVAYRAPVGYVSVVWVDAAARRRGVAGRLLACADRWFAERGAELVELSYLTQNETARKAWERLGFRPFRAQAYRRISGPDSD